MYRLLIVDNERIIVDSLLNYFERQQTLELEVLGAYSGPEALDIMESARIDILLTDIRMPVMDGLALQREVVRRWPWCRTIFLTGYSDFQYVREAIRTGGIDYLLKTDGREAILSSVARTVEQLDHRSTEEDLLHKAQHLWAHALPLLQHKLLLSLLDGRVDAGDNLAARFHQSEIKLRADSVLLALLRFDDPAETQEIGREVIVLSLQALASESFGERSALMQVACGDNALAWLVTYENDWSQKRRAVYLQGVVELAQQHLAANLGVHISACVAESEVNWPELPGLRKRLEYLLNRRMGRHQGMLLTESSDAEAIEVYASGQLRASLDKLELLEAYLESGNQADFYALLQEILIVSDAAPEALRPDVRAEITHQLLAIFFRHMNRWDLNDLVSKACDLNALDAPQRLEDWSRTAEQLYHFFQTLFDIKSRFIDRQDDDLIRRVQWTIEQNLGGDLSMTRLGESVGLNPYYLARLYKSITGERLKNYISAKRLERAMELLREGKLHGREIGLAVGFTTEQSFIRFFKGLCGMTPNEYRTKR